MNKRNWTKPLPVAGMVAALALGGSGAALAAGGTQKIAPVSPSATAASGNVISATFTNAAGAQTFGSVACPANTRVSGGGAFGSAGLQQHINSSYPAFNGSGWNVFMNNVSTTSASFTVYAICSLAS